MSFVPQRVTTTRRTVAAGAALVLALALGVAGLTTASSAGVSASAVVQRPVTAVSVGHVTKRAGGDGDDGPDAAEGSPNVCAGCTPPLINRGGAVMGTQPTPGGPVTAPGVITITPIYWAPTGYSFPSVYTSVQNRFITDLAADSGKTTNPYSAVAEYTANVNGVSTQFKYAVTAGPVLTDTDAFPAAAAQCSEPAGTAYTACIPDTSIQPELTSFLAANKQPTDLSHIYVLFFPPKVQTQELTSRSGDAYCGIHRAYNLTNAAGGVTGSVVYADEPYLDCSGGQTPDLTTASFDNGTYQDIVIADGEPSIILHEVAEAVTDPQLAGSLGYSDDAGNEIGDECNFIHGPSVGVANPSFPDDSQYNITINKHFYYLELGYSNKSFLASGDGRGCLRGAYGSPTAMTAPHSLQSGEGPTDHFSAKDDSEADPSLPASTTVEAANSDIAADGESTTTVTVTVVDSDGNPVADDPVNFHVSDANQGEAENTNGTNIETGQCGLIEGSDAVDGFSTNSAGQVFATYRASIDNGACSVLANESIGGTANDTVVFQGTSAQTAPSIAESIPTSLTAGGAPLTFSTTARNNSTHNLLNTQNVIYLSGDDTGDTGLDASQVTMTYSGDFTNNQPVPLTLSGSTANGGYIEGDVDPGTTTEFPAGSAETVTFKVSIDKAGADSTVTGDPLTVETDFNQVNGASGANSTIASDSADAFVIPAKSTTTPTPVIVTTPASTTTTIYQPIQTVIMTIPGPAAKPAVCKVPNLLGKNVAQVKDALKTAKCFNTTLTVPTTKKGQKLVFSVDSPTRSHLVAANGNLSVKFKIVNPKNK